MAYNILLHIQNDILRQIIAEQLAYIPGYNASNFSANNQAYDLLVIDIDNAELENFMPLAHIPIFALGKDSDIQQQITKLPFTISDYLNKPFRIAQLLSRIHTRLSKNALCFSCGKYKFYAEKNLFISDDNEKIKITPKEVAVISYLYKNKDRTVSSRELFNSQIGVQEIGLYRLRQKLNDSNILQKTKEGYRLNL